MRPMQALLRKAALVIADRYLSGRRYSSMDVAPDLKVTSTQLKAAVRTVCHSYEDFVRQVIPGETKTSRCVSCDDVVQTRKKDSKVQACIRCKRMEAEAIIRARIAAEQPVTAGVMCEIPKYSWIVSKARILWGCTYTDMLSSRFGIYPRPDTIIKRRDGSVKEQAQPDRKTRATAPEALRTVSDRNKLVRRNLNLVWFLADRYLKFKRIRHLTRDDLVQEGMVGLIRAAEKFDEKRGFKFSTYAAWWIRQAMERAWRAHNFAVYLPSRFTFRALPGVSSNSTVSEIVLELMDADRYAEEMREAPVRAPDGRVINSEPIESRRNRLGEMVQPRKSPEDYRVDMARIVQALGAGSMDALTPEILCQLGSDVTDAGFARVEEGYDEEREVAELLRKAAYGQIPAEHLSMFCKKNFGGCTLTDLALEYRISRERVRQLVTGVRDKLRVLLQDRNPHVTRGQRHDA